MPEWSSVALPMERAALVERTRINLRSRELEKQHQALQHPTEEQTCLMGFGASDVTRDRRMMTEIAA